MITRYTELLTKIKKYYYYIYLVNLLLYSFNYLKFFKIFLSKLYELQTTLEDKLVHFFIISKYLTYKYYYKISYIELCFYFIEIFHLKYLILHILDMLDPYTYSIIKINYYYKCIYMLIKIFIYKYYYKTDIIYCKNIKIKHLYNI